MGEEKMRCIRKSAWLTVGLMSAALTLPAAWTSKRLTNTTGESYRPTIAAAGSYVYVVWHDKTPGNAEIYFRRSIDGGATWETAKRLTNNWGDSVTPSIAVEGSTVYVAWSDWSADPVTPQGEIYFKKSTDNGKTWQPTKRLTNMPGDSYKPRIEAEGSNVFVVWYDIAPGNLEIYFRRSIDEGATWQTVKRLTNDVGESSFPTIAANSTNVYIVWDDYRGYNEEIYFKKSEDSGASWGTSKRLTDNTGYSERPKIAVRAANLYVVWHDDSLGHREIYFKKSTDGGETWLNNRKLTTTTATFYSGYPSLAVYTTKIYVVYENDENVDCDSEILFKKSGDSGATWPTTQPLTDNAGTSYYPEIALGGAKIYVVWTDDTPGNWEIYLKYCPLS